MQVIWLQKQAAVNIANFAAVLLYMIEKKVKCSIHVVVAFLLDGTHERVPYKKFFLP